LRAGEVITERTFDVLPAGCEDRLAAIALVVAVALEHAGAKPQAREADALDQAARSARSKGPEEEAPAQEGPAPTPNAAEPAQQAKPAQAPTSAPPAARKVEEPSETKDSVAPADHDGPRVLAYAAGGVAIGLVPQPTWLLELGGGARLPPFRFEAAALMTGENGADLGPGRVRERLFGGRAHGCAGAVLGLLEGEECAGLLAGVVTAQGRGLEDARSTSMALVAPLLQLAIGIPASGPFHVRAAVTGFVPVVRPRPRFLREDGGDSLRAAAAGLLATLAFVVTLP
jgi:hypothetical protein